MSEEELYEIESITQARIKKVNNRKQWQFLVRWKNYPPEEDTWEPMENMQGSEETVQYFLQRINTGGRDYRDLKLFKQGEVFLPVGPPKKRNVKGKKKEVESELEVVEATPDADLPSYSRARKRDSDDAGNEDEPSSKRPRPTLATFGSKPNLLLTEADSTLKSPAMKKAASGLPSERQTSPQKKDEAQVPKPDLGDLLDFSEDTAVSRPASEKAAVVNPDVNSLSPVRSSISTMPLHRARIANPLVKPLPEEPLSSVIKSNKNDKGLSPPPKKTSSTPKRKRPGPGRSSEGLIRAPTLLTMEKGKLKSVKGKRKLEDYSRKVNNKAEEDTYSADVSEGYMEQDTPVELPKPGELLHLAGGDKPGSADLPEFEDDEGNLTPTIQNPESSTNGNALPSAVRESLLPTATSEVESHPEWKRPTIFGLLGLGADVSNPISSIPLDQSRLCNDELFVQMIGRDLLAFCSSRNAFFTQRLNIVPSLLSADAIIVAHVYIEDQSAFADVAANADDTVWSQYILAAGAA
ncbi:hypothetical protein NP233_g5625 [Leucocoprinus birnbaumii]|uniref:Chromo domain-containing protein n=1 Tax=Leucocoprinus birnbaumii TaxID=56174 RepID=A0AAD5VTQ7_9AGAR|nr:hypothetical protein NP233_g5625 [Leucocoprinus birnbaumii]